MSCRRVPAVSSPPPRAAPPRPASSEAGSRGGRRADRFVRGGLHDCSSTACALLRPFAPFPWASPVRRGHGRPPVAVLRVARQPSLPASFRYLKKMNGQMAAMRAPVTPELLQALQWQGRVACWTDSSPIFPSDSQADREPLGATGGLAPVVQPACASRDGMGRGASRSWPFRPLLSTWDVTANDCDAERRRAAWSRQLNPGSGAQIGCCCQHTTTDQAQH